MPTSGGGVTSMAAIVTDIGTVLTGLISSIGDVFAGLFAIDIVKYILLMGIAVGLVFATVRIVKRFTGQRQI